MKRFLFAVVTAISTVSFAEVVSVDYNSHLAGNAWQPGKIVFSFREPISFTQWESSTPTEIAALTLFPGYKEPQKDEEENGLLKTVKDDQHVFVGRATFIVNKPPSAVNVQNYINLEYLKEADAQIEHTQISPEQIFKSRKTGRPAIVRPSGDWCTTPNSLCVQSTWNYPLTLRGIIIAVSLVTGSKDTFTQTQSELSPTDPAHAAQLQPLAQAQAPVVSGLQQSVFYVNQFLRWGKNVVIFQADPQNPNQTLATAYFVVALSSKYYDVEKHKPGIVSILKKMNVMPREFILGQSTANDHSSPKTMMAGLPEYSTAMAEAMAKSLNK